MVALHRLHNTVRRPSRKRVGRGNGNNWGRTCGRGEKGQKSRSGFSRRPYFEGGQISLFRRLPKRGFNNPRHKTYMIVNLSDLERTFDNGATVDIDTLKGKGLIYHRGPELKILANGELHKKLTIKAHHFSATAKEKIEAQGGNCEYIQ